MDVAVELEDELESENFTINATALNDYYDGLYPHQVGGLFFTLFCLAPNILIVYIICKHKLSSTIYWTIMNWTILNTTLLLNFLPLSIIPAKFIANKAVEFMYYFGVVLVTFTGVLVTLFMFEFYIKSEKICKYTTIFIWCLIVSADICIVLVIEDGQIRSYVATLTLELIFFVTIVMFAARVIRSWIRPSCEETYRLRIRLCSTYLTCLFLVWITDLMAAVHTYYLFITFISSILIYLDGYINLIVLIYFDPRIKRHFMQMFCKSSKYSDIKFDAQNSSVSVVGQIA